MSEKFKCWMCGRSIEFYTEPIERVYCNACKIRKNNKHKELIREYAALKVRIMHENALRIMEKSQKCYMHEYLESANRIYEMALDNTEAFMSAHEMIVGMVLDNYGIGYESNHKILNYRVDFYIPEFKVFLEVDGDQHRHRFDYDNKRDIQIRKELGSEWESIRIPTKYIEENPEKIPDAIEEMAKEKRRLRKKFGGYMPYGFSKRDNRNYRRVQ